MNTLKIQILVLIQRERAPIDGVGEQI
jgi:hypothetical protein